MEKQQEYLTMGWKLCSSCYGHSTSTKNTISTTSRSHDLPINTRGSSHKLNNCQAKSIGVGCPSYASESSIQRGEQLTILRATENKCFNDTRKLGRKPTTIQEESVEISIGEDPCDSKSNCDRSDTANCVPESDRSIESGRNLSSPKIQGPVTINAKQSSQNRLNNIKNEKSKSNWFRTSKIKKSWLSKPSSVHPCNEHESTEMNEKEIVNNDISKNHQEVLSFTQRNQKSPLKSLLTSSWIRTKSIQSIGVLVFGLNNSGKTSVVRYLHRGELIV